VNTAGANPVFAYVASHLDLMSPVANEGPAGRFFLGYLGTRDASVDGPFQGTIVAPNAELRLRNRLLRVVAGVLDDVVEEVLPPLANDEEITPRVFRGSFFAADVRIDRRVTLAFEVFTAWEFLFLLCRSSIA
jgi:hypothetical protein